MIDQGRQFVIAFGTIKTIFVSGVMILALVLAGCGSSGDTAQVAPESTLTVPTASAAPTEQAVIPDESPAVPTSAPTATSQPMSVPVAVGEPSSPVPIERLVIPALGINVAPITVGLDEQRIPIVPRHDVGWYSGSTVPGQGSNIVLWGHVLRWKDSPQTPAPFERLHELEPGAEILVITTDQQTHRYQVTQQIEVRPDTVTYLLPTPFERITLISCIGDDVIVDGNLTKALRLVTLAAPVR